METVRFHIAQAAFFLGTFFFSHLVGPSKQFGTHEKLSWGVQGWSISRRPSSPVHFATQADHVAQNHILLPPTVGSPHCIVLSPKQSKLATVSSPLGTGLYPIST